MCHIGRVDRGTNNQVHTVVLNVHKKHYTHTFAPTAFFQQSGTAPAGHHHQPQQQLAHLPLDSPWPALPPERVLRNPAWELEGLEYNSVSSNLGPHYGVYQVKGQEAYKGHAVLSSGRLQH